MDNKFDVLIIGSGLGGLLCANILSKKGFKVGVLEKNAIPGGCLQTFKRKNVVFDTGIHYVGSLDKDQRLYKLFNYLGIIPELKLRKLDPNGFDQFQLGDVEFKYASGYENFIETLSETFPKDYSSIHQFTNKIRSISESIPLYNLKPGIENSGSFFEKINFGGTQNFLNSITKNNALINALSSLNALYGGSKEGSFLYIHALIYNHYIESAYRFVDGSSQLTNLLIKQLELNGGQLITSEEATKFNFNDKSIRSICSREGNEYFASNFISAIHPQNTLSMIEDGKVRKSYRRRINAVKNTSSSFSLYIILHNKKVPYMNSNKYLYPSGNVWNGISYNQKKWPESCFIYPVADSRDETYTRGVSVLTMMDFKEFEPWEDTKVELRGSQYLDFKELKAQQLIEFLKKYAPEIGNNIAHYYISTPLTYRDYTGTPKGSIYGIERDVQKPLDSFITQKTKIPNLLFTGQNAGLHGMLGVSISALLTCAELTDLNLILEEINR